MNCRMTWPQLLRQVIEVAGVEVYLSPKQHLIAQLLLINNHRLVSPGELTEWTWGKEMGCLTQQVYLMRKRGVPVINQNGRGYGLS